MQDENAEKQLQFYRFYAMLMSALSTVFLIGAYSARSGSFDTIDANLINVRDSNGDVRMALFGKDHEPSIIVAGKRYVGRAGGAAADAGIMFYDDRRDEIGGLIFGTHASHDGETDQGQSLTFDAYRQDQVVQLFHQQQGADRLAGLAITDRPQVSLAKVIPLFERASRLSKSERDAELQRLEDMGYGGARRLFAGIDKTDSTITLRDAKGRTRLRLIVGADGAPRIEFLSANGSIRRIVSDAR